MPRPVANPPNPRATQHVEWLEEPPCVALEVHEEDAKSILSENDSDIPELLTRARDAGAGNAFLTMLSLPAEVRSVFRERLAAAYPDRAARIWRQIRDVRRGCENDSTIGRRMTGDAPRWRATEDLFRLKCRRLGLTTGNWCEGLVARPRTAGRQGTLFGG